MRIRTATNSDSDSIREVHLCAFPEEENEIVAELAASLLAEQTTPQTLSLVAEIGGAVVGQVVFSPVSIEGHEHLQGYILAPLGVKAGYQKQRIGSALIERGIQALSDLGACILFVYGDPKYYGRFGFTTESAEKYIPPCKLQYPFGWQALVLNEFQIDSATSHLLCVPALSDPKLW